MPDDYTEPAIPQTQDKRCQPRTEKPDFRTVTPVTKIGSSFEELRNYKIPKIKRPVPPTKEHGSRVSRTYPVSPVSKKRREKQDEHREELSSSPSSSPAVSTSSSNVLLDKIIEDMNKAYPKVSGCYVSCRDSCPHRNQVHEFPKSPAKCPLEDNQELSKSAILDCAPVSNHIGQKHQMKVCTVCKRKNVSEGLGQDTCIRCSLYEQINKEQAAVKEHGSKERQAVRKPDVPAKVQARRSSSDVENKELVTRTPTSPRSRSKSKSRTSNTDNVSTASPQANEHNNVLRKRRRKTYLTKQIISSSDDSCTSEDDICAAAASAVPASQDGANSLQYRQPRPQRKCRALSESPQNVTEEPAQKDDSQDPEEPLTTGPKDSKAKSKFRRVQGIKPKPKCRRMQGKGSNDEKLRRKVMREAWKKAKDTEDYLRALGEMEKSIKATKTLRKENVAEKSEEHKNIGSINNGHTYAKSVPEEHEQQFKSVKGDHTDANPTVEGHEQLGSINGGHTCAKSVPEEHEQQFESVKGDRTDANRTVGGHEQLESVKCERPDANPTVEGHEQLESLKCERPDANPTVEGHEQLESVKCERPDANPEVAEHEELQNVKCEHADAKPASEEQCGEVAIDIGGLASDSLVLANSPPLVVASCCSLSLTDWEGMQNESMDGVTSEAVSGEVNKVASACTLPSDGALSDSHASTSSEKCAGKAVLPSAMVIDLSDDTLNGKHIDAVMKCLVKLPYLLSFEDDGAMSVTIRDGVSGDGGREEGFSAKESGELVQQPQEVRPPSSSDPDNMAAFTASLQEGDFTLYPGKVVGKSHLDGKVAPTDTDTRKGGTKILAEKPGSSKPEEPAAFSASSVLPPSPCGNSSRHISVDTSAASERGAVHCNFDAHVLYRADTVCSSNKDSSPVIPAESGAPLTQPSLCATEDVTEAHVNISYAAQGASCSGSVSSLGVSALSIGQRMLSEAADIKSLGMDGTTYGTVNGSLPSSIDSASPANQAVSATPMNMNTANTKSSCTAKHNVEKGCLPNNGVAPSGTDHLLLLAIESMGMSCRRRFTAKDNVRSSYLQHEEHSASRMAQSQLHSSHLHSSRVHSTHANGHSSRNVLPQSSWDSSGRTARLVWPSAEDVGTSDSPACFDTVSLVDAVFGTPKASIGTIDRGCAGRGGRLYQMLEEYVQNVERFLAALHQCTPGYRDRLVSTLLPEGIVGLKRIVQLVWRMEAELQCLGRDRVSDLDKGVFSLLMEHTGNLSKTTAEQDLPTFMSFQVHIEPQLQTLADPLCQEVADDGQHTNCSEVLEHHTELNCAADVASEAVSRLGGAKAPTVSVPFVDRAVTKTADNAEVLITDDPDEEGQMADAPAASCQRAVTGVQTNGVQGLGIITAVRRPSDSLSEKGEMAGQPKSPQATTVDGAVRGTAHTTATVDASRLEQGQQSTGMSCPPRAASGILKNDVLYDASLTAKPNNLDAISSAKVCQHANAKEATRVQTDGTVSVSATSIHSSDRNSIITAVWWPPDSLSEKGEMAGQPKSPQATTVDGAVRGTAHTTATVDASRLEQGQQSTGMSWPPRAAAGILQNGVLYDASLMAKPKNLDAVSSAKVFQGASAKEATTVQTDAAVAVAATSIHSSDRHRLPPTEKAAQPRQQRWDQGPRTAPTANQNSMLSTGMERDPTMRNRQQPDGSALRSLFMRQRATSTGCESLGDTFSTAQQSSQAPKRSVAQVNSQQGISRDIPSNQNSTQGQQAHSAAGRPQQARQLHFQLREPPPLMYAGPHQHTVQNEGACTQQSIMNSRQREELAKQFAWLNAHGLPGNLQGPSGPAYSSARQFCKAPDCIRTGQPCSHASRRVHAQGYAPQPEPRQGTSNTHTQPQERDLRLQQQHVQGQQYAANTDASNPLPAPSASYGSQITPMDAALIQAESEVLSQLKIHQYLKLLTHKIEAGQVAPAPGQQPGCYKAPERRQLSEREKHLQQQINVALNAFTKGAAQNAQQWQLRAYQSFQQPPQYPTAQHSYESSAQPRADMNNSSARISEESVSLECPAGFVRPWADKPKWPEPYAACQDALQRWKNRQYEGEPKTKVPRDAVEQTVDEYRAASNVRPQQIMEAQDHVLMRQVSAPEQNRNIAQSDISHHVPVHHTAVPGPSQNIMARYDASGQAPAGQEVSVSQQSGNFVASSGVSGGNYRERRTSIWHPLNTILQLSAGAEASRGHLAKNRAASSTTLPSQQIPREGFVFQRVPGQPSNSVQGTLPQ